jgi:hypothetical protein
MLGAIMVALVAGVLQEEAPYLQPHCNNSRRARIADDNMLSVE